MEITNSTIGLIQFLRNGKTYSSKTEAIAALSNASGLKDGVLVLARYVENNTIKSLVGCYAEKSSISNISGSSTVSSTMTIIDAEYSTLSDKFDSLSSVTNTKITQEVNDRKAADSALQTNINNLSSATDTKISSEATARVNADTTLQNNINSVNSNLTAHTSNTVIHVTQADKDKWNTPTDLSDYYTKSEVDTKLDEINETIELYGQVTSQSLNDLNDRLSSIMDVVDAGGY